MTRALRNSASIMLGNETLHLLPRHVARPAYDRSQLTPGIVHIGLGNFHRAHQAWYLHRLMQEGKAHDWAIIGAGVRPCDSTMRNKLLAQDCLTTLIELDPSGERRTEVIGPMIDYVPVTDGNGPLIGAMADPAIRIVSLTVTEGGYFIDPATGGFDASHPDIQHDAANPDVPRTAFGAMATALRIRRDSGLPPFTSQSCDNLQGNGAILRRTIVSLARMSDPELADWIDSFAAFPNSMVDCIVPATGPAEIALAAELGIKDTAPVTHESYRQWVTEDTFCAGRPDWDHTGLIFSDNVHDYENMKIRILNAGHQIIANPGEILSIDTIAECMADPQLREYFSKVQTEEIGRYVGAVPGIEPATYADLIKKRFSNPAIKDTTRRVAFDGSSRHSGFLLPILRDALNAGGAISGLSLAEALWARMCEGTREDGSRIEANDPHWECLSKAGRAARRHPTAWLEQSRFYGDLAANSRFAKSFDFWLTRIWEKGTRFAIDAYCKNSL